MDGMLLVTFFFPALVSFNIVVLEIVKSNPLTQAHAQNVSEWLGLVKTHVDQADKQISTFWPIFVSGVTIWTTATTYGMGGAARHGKKGWKFVQPGVGGVRFVLVQIFTWVTFALSVGMPWTTLEHFGWLTMLGVLPSSKEDPMSQRGLLVVGSALGMLSQTFCVLGLMSFDPKEKITLDETMSRSRRKFEIGKWKWNVFGDSETWWWLFLALQGTFVVFSWQLAVMLEMSSAVRNNIVESLLLMVVTAFLAIPVALTNAVAGKWKHGERNYRLTMPFQGGAVFVALQALGWTFFAGSFLVTLFKLYSTATMSGTKVSISSTASFGFVSFLCIVASLFVFDPNQVQRGQDETVSDSEDNDSEPSAVDNKKAHTVLGKRQSPTVKGALEYLVQWKAMESPNWVLEELLMKEDPDAIRNSEKSVRTPRIEHQQRRYTNSKGRSISPRLKPERQDEEDDDEDDTSGNGALDNTDSDSEDVWEEVEDEEGNVFYYNEKRKLAQTQLPRQFAEALARQQTQH